MKSFYSNGKLLLTGEYAVLDGALSLAMPTAYGQSLKVSETDSQKVIWKSLDEKGNVWFEGEFGLPQVEHTSNGRSSFSLSQEGNLLAKTLLKILREAKKMNPIFLNDEKGYKVETSLDFPRNWGLGSSSTLINNIAQWAEVDAFELLWNAFSGSGYDIACAQHDHAVLYRLQDGKPSVIEVDFDPPFKDHLYFIHLNKKQNSREGIAQYRKIDFDREQLIKNISTITERAVHCKNLHDFESLLAEHETLLSKKLQIPTVKESLFHDFKGAVKSLGAWGGDFVLATGDEETPTYFRKKGFSTVIRYHEMVLGKEN